MEAAYWEAWEDVETMNHQRSDNIETSTSNGVKGMPWWVKAVSIFGTTAAIAMYLVYSLPAAAETNALVKAHIESANRMELNHQEHERALERILRAICVNGAENYPSRQTCLQ